MGCSGSTTFARTKAVDVVGTETHYDQSVQTGVETFFEVTLENPKGRLAFGATACSSEKQYIRIEDVGDYGLIPAWNRRNKHCPDAQLQSGDIIVVVNGVFGNSDLMMKEATSPNVSMAVKRRWGTTPDCGYHPPQFTGAFDEPSFEKPVVLSKQAAAAAADFNKAVAIDDEEESTGSFNSSFTDFNVEACAVGVPVSVAPHPAATAAQHTAYGYLPRRAPHMAAAEGRYGAEYNNSVNSSSACAAVTSWELAAEQQAFEDVELMEWHSEVFAPALDGFGPRQRMPMSVR